MKEFWESKFKEIKDAWGDEPAEAAYFALDFFRFKQLKKILIPGCGYGRNAKLFCDHGFEVTGIEISEFAVELAKKTLAPSVKIHVGSVNDMPFDEEVYDGIFSYALLHLLNEEQRQRFIENCMKQLKSGGYLIFSVLSKSSPMYGQGILIDKDFYEISPGLNVFFYDKYSVKREFQDFGSVECFELDEPIKFNKEEPPMKMLIIKVKKQ